MVSTGSTRPRLNISFQSRLAKFRASIGSSTMFWAKASRQFWPSAGLAPVTWYSGWRIIVAEQRLLATLASGAQRAGRFPFVVFSAYSPVARSVTMYEPT